MIIETTVSLHIMKQLKDKHCAVIVGHQGNGKSSILQHIALLECNNEDFDIIPIVIEPNYITQYYNPKRNQIFLVDDLCGKEKVNSQHIDIWNLYIKDVIQIIKRGSYSDADKNEKNRGKTKILISCNETIYNDPVFRCLKEKLDHYVCFLSKYPLSEEEKKEMLRKYSPGADAGFENMNRKEIDFPLLCKLTKGKSIEEIKELFSNPVSFIKNDLNELRNKNNLQFCIIALCTLFDNSFEAKWLQGDVMPKNVKSAAEEIGLDLKKESTIKYVQEEFEKQDLLYLSKTGTTYHLIHEEIHNIASVICGNIYTECFIRYSSSSFVAQRYRMEPANELRDKAVILAPKYYKRYFDRLLSDLENCDTYSTFHNIQLREKNYRDEFCKYCRKRKQKFIEILSKLKQNTQKCKSTENENDDDYGFLKCNIYFRDHKLGIPLIECAWEGHADMIKLLMEMDCNINETDGFGRTALFVASARGHLDVVEMLLYEHNADVSLSDKKKRTPLYSACEEGYEQIAIKLIEKGADILARDKDGCSSFFKACAHGHKHIAEILLEECKEEIHNTDNLGRTPIIEAARHGQKNIVIFLLDKGANMNDTDSKGFTPLYVASMKDYSQTVLVLLNKGADMLKLDNDGCTALYIACKNGCTKAVKKLVAKNKEIISIRDWHQRTPFYIACEEGHTDVVEILVKENVDVEVCEEDEKSPLYISCENGYLKVVQILLENSVNVNKCDRRDNSPLHAACKMGHFEIVQLLCSKGANLLHCDRRGGSPFFVACREGYIEIVKFLLDEYDYVLNKCDNSGNSPLFAACEEGNIEIVQFLLSNGADIEYANSKNISAIDAASAGGYEKIKKMLMDKKSSLKSNTAQQLPQSVGLRKKSLCLIPK